MKKIYEFIPLFEKFVQDSKRGKRLKKNGGLIKEGTIQNYEYTLRLVKMFAIEKKFTLKIPEFNTSNKREFQSVKSYWKKFYKQFTDYCYKDQHHYDNYVGQVIKNLRVFFNWLKTEKGIFAGDFHKDFYVRKEEVPIITLSKEQFQFLIFNKEFEESLSKPLQRSKDIFVLGCTVGLRISDLMLLTKNNIEERDNHTYLRVKSKKTGTGTCIKLPEYALEILSKKKRKQKTLFTSISLFRFNANIKKICELAGWTSPVAKTRDKKGMPVTVHQENKADKTYRFCDLVSSHTMRRTAITTMLSLGMPELLVRKISGHSDGSKAFYRYVELAQQFMDKEIELIHDKLQA